MYSSIDSRFALYCSVHLWAGIEHCFWYKRQLLYKNYIYIYYNMNIIYIYIYIYFGFFQTFEDSIYKWFYHIGFLEIVWAVTEWLGIQKKFLHGYPSKEFTEEWWSSVKNLDNKCRDLLEQEHCKKLFLLMGNFWDEIKKINFDLKWLFKVRSSREVAGNKI